MSVRAEVLEYEHVGLDPETSSGRLCRFRMTLSVQNEQCGVFIGIPSSRPGFYSGFKE